MYHLEVLSLDSSLDLLSLPQNFSFLREQMVNKLIVKRVLVEGSGVCANVTSRLVINTQFFLENGSLILAESGKPYFLSRNPSPAVHPGVHLSLYSMREGEKALIQLLPSFHVFEKFKNQTI